MAEEYDGKTPGFGEEEKGVGQGKRREGELINDVLQGMGLPPLAPDRRAVLRYLPRLISRSQP
jgi:hypothetical protein